MISTFKHTGSVMVKKSIDTREVAERERERDWQADGCPLWVNSKLAD